MVFRPLLLVWTLISLICCHVGLAMTPQWKATGVLSWKFEENEQNLSPINLLDLPTTTSIGTFPLRPFTVTVRGGSKRGVSTILSTTTKYWSTIFQRATLAVSNTFSSIRKPQFLKSKSQRRSDELMLKLQTTPVLHVVAPNSTVLPAQVVTIAAKRSGLIGRPMRTQAIQDLARNLKQWYERKGFILHSVTGATLQVDTETAELTVEEPISSRKPVEIIYCREMVIDDEDGSLVTFRKYREKHTRRRTLGHDKITKSSLNTTFVPDVKPGKTSPRRIANVLGLIPGRPFVWNPNRWSAIQASGLFQNVLRASPERMQDGSVQLQVFAIEAPTRNLEYGMGTNGFNGAFEGEVVFQHKNLLGGGESLGVTARRGRKDAEASIKVQFKDDNFGLPGGYEFDCFSDYVGEHLSDDEATGEDYDHDDLLVRRGLSFMFRNPVSPTVLTHSAATACLERTSTKGGRHENVASSAINVGPMTKELPLDARTNVMGKVTLGSRLSGTEGTAEDSSSKGFKLSPFSTVTAITQQSFPLGNVMDRPVLLAFQHSATASTRGLPRHNANANGIASRIRGFKESGRVTTSLVGSTELRIPVPLPTDKLRQDASVVLYRDYSLAQETVSSLFKRKSSIGIGFRKSLQGIPLKFDVSYSSEGKVDTALGFGVDFQV